MKIQMNSHEIINHGHFNFFFVIHQAVIIYSDAFLKALANRYDTKFQEIHKKRLKCRYLITFNSHC